MLQDSILYIDIVTLMRYYPLVFSSNPSFVEFCLWADKIVRSKMAA